MKKYKECPPEQTIERIKSILAQNNIKVKVTKSNNGFFYSCRVDICNSRLSKIRLGTNGKGMTEKYSLASGYAEFMELLQNKLMFENESLCFEEHLMDSLKKSKIIDADCDDYNNCQFYNKSKIDFYSVKEKCIKQFCAYDFLFQSGSNGMCAGNSAKEAITQGICEIFERYVAAKIYNEKLSFPTIPLDYYEGTELHRRIKKFLKQNANIRVIIKDCSLDKGLPVVGVLVIDVENQVYNFNLGADCNPIVATERCFTELYQKKCFRNQLQSEKKILGVPIDFHYELTECDMEKAICNGSGLWPVSIFNDNTKFTFDRNSLFYQNKIENDLQYCVKVTDDFNSDIYIRDNSILGFPTYYIVIPGMNVPRECDHIEGKFTPQSDLYSKLGNLSKKDLEFLTLESEKDYIRLKELNESFDMTDYWPININNDLQNLDFELFLSLSMYKLRMYDKFLLYMDEFLKDKDRIEYVYFYAAYNFVLLYQVQKQDLESTTSVLEKCYGSELANEVIKDMINPDDIFKYYKFPSYPDCSKCKLKKDCRVDDAVQMCVDLRKKEVAANIDQMKLAEVFDFVI